MKVKCLPSYVKDQICLAYNNKTLTLKELAEHFTTSTRTIGRVLEERGLATPVPRLKGEAYQIMQLLKEYELDLAGLKTTLSMPALTPINVQLFMNQCTKDQLARFFYTSGLVKLAEIAKQTHDSQQQATQQREPATV